MIDPRAQVVVVTPVYEDAAAFAHLCQDLAAQFGRSVFVVAVDDGSVQQPLDIKGLVLAGLDGLVLQLGRNRGHQAALALGLAYVAEHLQPAQRVVLMDCDGEDLPVTVPVLLAALEAADKDLVVARRRRRVERWRFKLSYSLYKGLFRLMSGRTLDFGNFMALKSAAVRRLVAMPETSLHVAGSVLVSKLRVGACVLDRGARYAGHSKMNFSGLVLHGLKGLAVLGESVWVRVALVCALGLVLGMAAVLTGCLLGLGGAAHPGWWIPAGALLALLAGQTGAMALGMLMLTAWQREGRPAATTLYREAITGVLATGPVPPRP